jgi:hypothetical protein
MNAFSGAGIFHMTAGPEPDKLDETNPAGTTSLEETRTYAQSN